MLTNQFNNLKKNGTIGMVVLMNLIKKEEIKIKKSRFIGYYYNVIDKNEVDNILNDLRKEHKKATHLPYAFKIDNKVKKSDDKEPSNTAGTPILNIIEKKKLDNCLIVVVRYFGGIKLGAGGLIRAYSTCSNLVTSSK